MELNDGCILIKIPTHFRRAKKTFFSTSFTEYEIKVILHVRKFQTARRYSDFRHLLRTIPKGMTLPAFPKKKLLGSKDSDFINKRRLYLEQWINACLNHRELRSLVFEFLELPTHISASLLSYSGSQCQLTASERCVASFIRRLSQSDNTKSKALRKLGTEFFKCPEPLNERVSYLFLSKLMPLCGYEGVGARALYLFNSLINGDTYRYYQQIRGIMFSMDFKYFKDMSLDLHLLNGFQGDSPKIAYGIIQLVEEHYERQEIGHMLSYILSDNEEALEVFKNWHKSNVCVESAPLPADWNPIVSSTADFSAKYKLQDNYVTLIVEMIIEAPIEPIFNHLLDPELRKKWDCFVWEYRADEEPSESFQVTAVFPSYNSIKKEADLLCQARLTANHGIISFESTENSKYFLSAHYSLNNQDLKRTISSHSMSFESAESLNSFPTTERYSSVEQSRTVLFYKNTMSLELAKSLSSELIGETSFIERSWVNLKKIVEGKGDKSFISNKKCNMINEALHRKIIPTKKRTPKTASML